MMIMRGGSSAVSWRKRWEKFSVVEEEVEAV